MLLQIVAFRCDVAAIEIDEDHLRGNYVGGLSLAALQNSPGVHVASQSVFGGAVRFFCELLSKILIGRLPGDIRIEKENFKFYFPITTMILFSLLATAIIQIIRKIF